jgi:hypothetical protein
MNCAIVRGAKLVVVTISTLGVTISRATATTSRS